MQAVVLETGVLMSPSSSAYDDRLTSYQFPVRYLPFFDPLTEGAEMLAIIYEPRGNPLIGRVAYVGWATIKGLPSAESIDGKIRYRVEFTEPIHEFKWPVPREIAGVPIERWLRKFPKGRTRNTATRGRAVRSIAVEEIEEILRIGAPDSLGAPLGQASGKSSTQCDHDSPTRHLVSQLRRSERFKSQVLRAYDYRCAVSGLSSAGVDGIVEAAHIKGVGRPHYGPDDVANGIALTPTLHRLFDRRLFSFQFHNEDLLVVISKRLLPEMVCDVLAGSALPLLPRQKVRIPRASAFQPHRRYVDYHRSLME